VRPCSEARVNHCLALVRISLVQPFVPELDRDQLETDSVDAASELVLAKVLGPDTFFIVFNLSLEHVVTLRAGNDTDLIKQTHAFWGGMVNRF
jgi:hypothetical protein